MLPAIAVNEMIGLAIATELIFEAPIFPLAFKVKEVDADEADALLSVTASAVGSPRLTTPPGALACANKSKPDDPTNNMAAPPAVPSAVIFPPLAVNDMLGLVIAATPGVETEMLPLVLNVNVVAAVDGLKLSRVTASEVESVSVTAPATELAIKLVTPLPELLKPREMSWLTAALPVVVSVIVPACKVAVVRAPDWVIEPAEPVELAVSVIELALTEVPVSSAIEPSVVTSLTRVPPRMLCELSSWMFEAPCEASKS
jgi:hypothetical protein